MTDVWLPVERRAPGWHQGPWLVARAPRAQGKGFARESGKVRSHHAPSSSKIILWFLITLMVNSKLPPWPHRPRVIQSWPTDISGSTLYPSACPECSSHWPFEHATSGPLDVQFPLPGRSLPVAFCSAVYSSTFRS